MKYVGFSLILLTLAYLLVLGSFAPWDIVMGVAVSATLIYGTRRLVFREKPSSSNLFSRFVYFWPFVVAEVWNILTGTWNVALITLHLRPLVSPGIVAVPIGERTPTGVAVSAQCTTLSPGTFLVDVDWERRVMLIHALDAGDPDEVRRDHQEFYEKWQKKVFP
ncbi:Na+/H+ antiporter subunit E [soil metagenome]